jgi:cyclopropane-fatty-acyl-phospholipid synthase
MPVFSSTSGQKALPRYFAQSFAVLGALRIGRIEVALQDGRIFQATGSQAGPVGRIEVRNDDMFARLIREGNLGFSEAFMDGWWTSPDLQALLDVVLANNENVVHEFPGISLLRLLERARHWMRGNSRRQARRNISYHYDLGNAFYAKWLDETMTYSSALFKTGQEDLALAQRQKYASLCDQMGVREGDHLLEIGCGWGGFAEYAATERGARLTGLTLSREQHDFASERIFRAGLAERVKIVLRDYRDERGSYDGIASIEMFEAVGEKYWPVYFTSVHDRLRPGARATLQIITMADHLFEHYRGTVDFIRKNIFPGGMLPSRAVLERQISNAGLKRLYSVEFASSYSITLRRWFEAFNDNWDQLESMGFGPRFRKMWNFYLTSCAAGFQTGVTDVTQITMRRPE